MVILCFFFKFITSLFVFRLGLDLKVLLPNPTLFYISENLLYQPVNTHLKWTKTPRIVELCFLLYMKLFKLFVCVIK